MVTPFLSSPFPASLNSIAPGPIVADSICVSSLGFAAEFQKALVAPESACTETTTASGEIQVTYSPAAMYDLAAPESSPEIDEAELSSPFLKNIQTGKAGVFQNEKTSDVVEVLPPGRSILAENLPVENSPVKNSPVENSSGEILSHEDSFINIPVLKTAFSAGPEYTPAHEIIAAGDEFQGEKIKKISAKSDEDILPPVEDIPLLATGAVVEYIVHHLILPLASAENFQREQSGFESSSAFKTDDLVFSKAAATNSGREARPLPFFTMADGAAHAIAERNEPAGNHIFFRLEALPHIPVRATPGSQTLEAYLPEMPAHEEERVTAALESALEEINTDVLKTVATYDIPVLKTSGSVAFTQQNAITEVPQGNASGLTFMKQDTIPANPRQSVGLTQQDRKNIAYQPEENRPQSAFKENSAAAVPSADALPATKTTAEKSPLKSTVENPAVLKTGREAENVQQADQNAKATAIPRRVLEGPIVSIEVIVQKTVAPADLTNSKNTAFKSILSADKTPKNISSSAKNVLAEKPAVLLNHDTSKPPVQDVPPVAPGPAMASAHDFTMTREQAPHVRTSADTIAVAFAAPNPVGDISASAHVAPRIENSKDPNAFKRHPDNGNHSTVAPSGGKITADTLTANPFKTVLTEKPVAERLVTDRPAIEKPATEKSATEKPVTEKSTIEKPVIERLVAESVVTDRPLTEKPATHRFITEKPATEKLITEKPVIEKTATEKSLQRSLFKTPVSDEKPASEHTSQSAFKTAVTGINTKPQENNFHYNTRQAVAPDSSTLPSETLNSVNGPVAFSPDIIRQTVEPTPFKKKMENVVVNRHNSANQQPIDDTTFKNEHHLVDERRHDTEPDNESADGFKNAETTFSKKTFKEQQEESAYSPEDSKNSEPALRPQPNVPVAEYAASPKGDISPTADRSAFIAPHAAPVAVTHEANVPAKTGKVYVPVEQFAPVAVPAIGGLLREEGGGSMRLVLRPEALGEVKLSVVVGENDHTAVHFHVESHEAKKQIESQMPLLKEQLAQSGMVVEKITIEIKSDVKNQPASSGFQNFSQGRQEERESRQRFVDSFKYLKEAVKTSNQEGLRQFVAQYI